MKAEDMKIKDVMTRGVLTVPLEMNALEIAKAMAENDLSAVAVVDERGETVGLVSEMDILSKMRSRNWEILKFEDLMAPSVESISPSSTLAEASDIMVKKHIHRLLIMSEESVGASYRPVGILSAGDILKEMMKKRE